MMVGGVHPAAAGAWGAGGKELLLSVYNKFTRYGAIIKPEIGFIVNNDVKNSVNYLVLKL